MIIVAKDGSGDYASIQEAIDAVPGGGRNPTLIVVRMNEYQEHVLVNKDNLRIVGEARDRTVIQGDAAQSADRDTAVVVVTGRNVEIENLTVRNPAGEETEAGQGMAVLAEGDRGVWRNCRITAAHQPLQCGDVRAETKKESGHAESENCSPCASGRLYFEDCRIEGGSGLIAGSCRCWFERCSLVMKAAGAFAPADEMVFHRCTLTGPCPDGQGTPESTQSHGAKAVFLECSMDASAAPSARKMLTDEETAIHTLQEVLSGYDGWRPDHRIPTWFLCGDSTMAGYPESAFPMTGWGQVLQALLPETVFVENCAVCGRSSKSFVAEKRLGLIELCLRKGDKLIVSFSHNDEKSDPLRYTSPHGTFPEYLSLYLDAAQAHGAEPVLVTPIARRHFGKDGQLLATHGEYPAAMRTLADERGVRLVDMEKATMKLVQGLGEEESTKLYCHVEPGHPNYPDGAADNSHLHLRGAIRYASLFLSLFKGETATDGITFGADLSDLTGLISGEDSILQG